MDQDSDTQLLKATDQRLAERAQAGCLDAFEALVRRYHAPLVCFLGFYGVSSNDVDDVAQEAFLKCYLNLHRFDVTKKFRNWLYTIARRSLPRVRTTNLLGEEVADICCVEDEPDQQVLDAEARHSLWKVVRKVTSDEEFQLIWFRYAEQMTIGEIASIIQQSNDVCKMRLSRLRKKLKSHLKPFAGSNGGGPWGFNEKVA